MGQQRALTRAGVTAQDHDSAGTGDHVSHESIECLALTTAPEQRRGAGTVLRGQRRSARRWDGHLGRRGGESARCAGTVVRVDRGPLAASVGATDRSDNHNQPMIGSSLPPGRGAPARFLDFGLFLSVVNVRA